MKKIFEELINEANNGNVIIDGDDFPIAFDTIIFENNQEIFRNTKEYNKPILMIKNQALFYDKLTEYVETSLSLRNKMPTFATNVNRNKIKIIIAYLFANATTEDFANPIELINRNIAFFKDNTFEYLNEEIETELKNSFNNSNINIRNSEQSVFMETPKRIDISFTKKVKDENLRFIFPSISYGISTNSLGEKECYVYSIMHPKIKIDMTDEQTKYSKSISRELYKLNAGVINAETQEFKDYLSGLTSEYPENISDISVSSLISLTVFFSLLEKEQIKVIKAIPYLPIRYLSREIFTSDDMQFENQLRNIQIQTNITDKFIRSFRRMQHHLSGLEITNMPYEISEFLELKFKGVQYINNEKLIDIYNSVDKFKPTYKNHRL